MLLFNIELYIYYLFNRIWHGKRANETVDT